MDDLISRQALIDRLTDFNEWCKDARLRGTIFAVHVIKNMPSAEKTAHWIVNDDYDGDVYYSCSRCKGLWVTIDGTPQENGMKYCPHCGAKMEGEVK